MMQTKVIIGANFGDEGKGLLTDFLAASSNEDSIVVRFNGGAQAGHTVQLKNGTRHVFHHFGSGTFAGSATYLSRYFLVNPILFNSEYIALGKLGFSPTVYCDPNSLVTTPFDMVINQYAENMRAKSRHGSCGVGIGETVERNVYPEYRLTVKDLLNKSQLITRLNKIRGQWADFRLKQLNLNSFLTEADFAWFKDDNILNQFLLDIEHFLDSIKIIEQNDIKKYHNILFEGAQGLLLDQDHQWFPHVTRSNTGLKNVITLATELQINKIDVYYVTRCYLTRHGAGPLPNELTSNPCSNFDDKTNIKHDFQGQLRFAPLSLDLLKTSIDQDLAIAKANKINYQYHIVITCLDHYNSDIPYIFNNEAHTSSDTNLIALINEIFAPASLLVSYGPTRYTMKTISK